VLFPEIQGKCQGIARKDGARPALFSVRLLIVMFCCCVVLVVNCVVLVVNCVVLVVNCVVLLLIVLFLLILLFYVLFLCKCVLYYCHRVSTQLQLTNVSISKSRVIPLYVVMTKAGLEV
jgi:hypothetical protein